MSWLQSYVARGRDVSLLNSSHVHHCAHFSDYYCCILNFEHQVFMAHISLLPITYNHLCILYTQWRKIWQITLMSIRLFDSSYLHKKGHHCKMDDVCQAANSAALWVKHVMCWVIQ